MNCCYEFISTIVPAKIKIGVAYSRDFYIASFIMMKIKQAFSEDIIFERTDFSSCDIVITDYPLFDLPKEIDRIYILEIRRINPEKIGN